MGKKRKNKGFYFLFLILIFIFVLGVYSFFFLKIKKIECKSQFGACPEKIEKNMKSFENQTLRQIAKNKDNLRELFLEIEDVKIFFIPPSKVFFKVKIKNPLFAIFLPKQNIYALVDKEGVVVSFAKETDLVFFKLENESPSIGERISKEKLFSLHLLKQLKESFQIKEALFKEDGLYVYLDDGNMVILPFDGDISILKASLLLILSQLKLKEANNTIDKGKYEVVNYCEKMCIIDLRFKNPVIRKYE